jgi:Ankyrin repeats (3 copies)
MARKKAAKQQQSSALVPHKTPNLNSLLERAKLGVSRDVKTYLDAGGSATALVQITSRNKTVAVPLLFAILHHHKEQKEVAASIELLVNAGAQVDATAPDLEGNKRCALVWTACCSCCTLPLQTLLRLGADPCLVHPDDGRTALHVAAFRGGSVNKLKLLVAADPDHRVNQRDVLGATPLMCAALIQSSKHCTG